MRWNLLNTVPMSGGLEQRWQLRFGITLRSFQLGLNEKDTFAEVGPSEIGSSEIGSSKVSHTQVGTPEVSPNEECPSQVGSSEVGAFESGSNQIGPSVVLFLVSYLSSHKFACVQQQDIDAPAVCCYV